MIKVRVMNIMWIRPDPDEFAGSGSDPQFFCLTLIYEKVLKKVIIIGAATRKTSFCKFF